MGRPDGSELFAEFDTDGDGQIDREELRAGFKKMGEELSDADIDAIMSVADGDGDGTIDANEFIQMGKMTKEVEAMNAAMIDGMEALRVRLDNEVSDLTSSMVSSVSSVGVRLDATSYAIESRLSSEVSTLSSTLDNTVARVDADVRTMGDTLSQDLANCRPHTPRLVPDPCLRL